MQEIAKILKIDGANANFVDEVGSQDNTPEILIGTSVNIKLDLRSSQVDPASGELLPLPISEVNASSLYLAIDEDYKDSTPVKLLSTDNISIASVDGKTFLQATIPNTNTVALNNAVKDVSSVALYCEIGGYDTNAKRCFAFQFGIRIRNAIYNPDEMIPEATEENFYNKVQVNALLNLPFDLQFSVDGQTNWHDVQSDDDRFSHQRKQNSTGAWGGPTKLIQGNQGNTGEKGDPFTYSDFTAEQLENLKSKGNFLHNGEGFISQRGATSTASNTPRFIDDRFYYLPINPTATITATNAGTGEISVVCSDGNFICRQPQTAKDIYYIFGQHFTMFSEANNILTHKIILIKNDDTEEIINGVINSDGSTTFDLTSKNTADFKTVYFDFTSTTASTNIKYRHAEIGKIFKGKDYKNRTLELLSCQPYYYQIHYKRSIALYSFSVDHGGNGSALNIPLPVTMRTTPDVIIGEWFYYDGGSWISAVTSSIQIYDNKLAMLRLVTNSNINKMIIPETNESGVITFSAEL